MKILQAAILLLCLGMSACADRSTGIALGIGTHGAGVALFTDNFWMGLGSFGEVMVGFGGGSYREDSAYSSGRIVSRGPAGPLIAPSADRTWHHAYEYLSLLKVYQKFR